MSAVSKPNNIYGLTRNTRPRGVQFILSGSKRFRKNGGPHLKGSRRPQKKVAFWVHPPYEPLAVKIVLRGFKGVPGGFAKAPRAPSFGNDSSDNDKPLFTDRKKNKNMRNIPFTKNKTKHRARRVEEVRLRRFAVQTRQR